MALVHPSKFEDVTIGVMCDGTRYDKTDDPVEWDVFRTEVLEGQGWKLLRLFSPNVFRDLEAVLAQIKREHENCVQISFRGTVVKRLRNLASLIKCTVRDDTGGEVIEYVLIIGLIVVATITTIAAFGKRARMRLTRLRRCEGVPSICR